METANFNYFQSTCTWKATEGKNISEAIAWSDRNENSDIEETIQAENCVLLESPTETTEAGPPTNECWLMLLANPPYLIQKVTVLCEARLIEVYGRHTEYLKTIRNQIVDEVEDMVVFRGDVQLDRPSPECSLKFTGLKVKTSMWLYGVTVKVYPIQSNTPPASTLLSPPISGIDRNRNNAQFMSVMASLFGPQIDHRPAAVPVANPPQPDMMGLFMSLMQANQAQTPASTMPIASTTSQQTVPALSSPTQQQSVMQLISQIAQQQIAQHYPVPNVQLQNGPEVQSLANAQPIVNGVSSNATFPQNGIINNDENVPNANNQTQQRHEPEKEMKPMNTQIDEITTNVEKNTVEPVANPPNNLTVEKPGSSTTVQPTGLSKSVGGTPSREAALELPAEVVDQITDSVVNNIECGLENMEQRLWGKILNRLQEMETRIMARMEEVIDALREVEDEADERETPEREDEPDLEDEEEDAESVLKV